MDKVLNARNIYRLLRATNISQRYFVQDLSLPRENVLKFLQFIDKELKIYPLWLCPLQSGKNDKLSSSCLNTDLVINVGVWGEMKCDYSNFLQANRRVEDEVRNLGGRKVLYAHAYYPRGDFWEIYDQKWYNNLRKKYFAGSVFPDIYEKTRVLEKYQPSILVGLWKAWRSSKLPTS